MRTSTRESRHRRRPSRRATSPSPGGCARTPNRQTCAIASSAPGMCWPTRRPAWRPTSPHCRSTWPIRPTCGSPRSVATIRSWTKRRWTPGSTSPASRSAGCRRATRCAARCTSATRVVRGRGAITSAGSGTGPLRWHGSCSRRASRWSMAWRWSRTSGGEGSGPRSPRQRSGARAIARATGSRSSRHRAWAAGHTSGSASAPSRPTAGTSARRDHRRPTRARSRRCRRVHLQPPKRGPLRRRSLTRGASSARTVNATPARPTHSTSCSRTTTGSASARGSSSTPNRGTASLTRATPR